MIFDWGARTFVMGVINVTPDSFSADGVMGSPIPGSDDTIERAVIQAVGFAAAGADVLDIGGESTRPGSEPVTAEEEAARVLPVIRAVREATALPISVDTYRADVAEAALDGGADWINDVWGLRMDEDMAPLIAKYDCPIILMHNRSKPKNAVQEARLGGRYVGVHYDDLLLDVRHELESSIEMATEAGIRAENIILDPGIGFGKTVEQSLELLNRLSELKELGFPLLVGPSRKSFIGFTLDLPPDQRVEGTAATVAIAIARGADIVRVHDVAAMVRVTRMTDAIVRRKN